MESTPVAPATAQTGASVPLCPGALDREAGLAARVQANPAAFAEIYDRHFARVYAYVRYRVPNAHVADDITSLAFSRALERIASFDAERGSLSVWLMAIARNAVNDWLRAEKRHPLLALDADQERPSGEPHPEERILRRERRQTLLRAMARLEERQRDLIGLKFAAGLGNRRIAELTGLSESNVGVILYRTVRKLRRLLDEEEGHVGA